MDKNEEYFLRNQLADIIDENVNKRLDLAYSFCKDNFSRMIAYPLASLENKNKKMSELSIRMGFDAFELLITLNPLREATYWFIREMLKRQKKISVTECFFEYDKEDFGEQYFTAVLDLYKTFQNGKQLRINRSLAKVKLNEIDENEYEILYPRINEDYSKEMLYYYGLDDASKNEAEQKKVIQVDKYLFEKFNPEKLLKFPQRIFEYLNKMSNMESIIDAKLYRLCVKRVSVDVNKIACELESEIIKNRKELLNVLALFYYLSRLCMHKYMFQSVTPLNLQENRKNYCDFTKNTIVMLGEQVGLDAETLNKYIDYFSMDITVNKGGFGEFPLLSFDNRIIWMPSSIILNDFQFSIVNGHYFKDILFPKHEETIAQSIVDYIFDNVKNYKNIVYKGNYPYSVPDIKYNGKDLRSDIDVALYDIQNHVLLIIECKWKENVYAFTDDYVRIERAVNEVYRQQLDKHRYYLEMDKGNINKIFDETVKISERFEELKIMYLIVDKRVQFHDKINNRHVISTFMLAYFFKKYAEEDNLNLMEIINEIQSQKSEAVYERVPLEKSILIGNVKIV